MEIHENTSYQIVNRYNNLSLTAFLLQSEVDGNFFYDSDPNNITGQHESDSNDWIFFWNSGGGPNLGGNWTIVNAVSCAMLGGNWNPKPSNESMKRDSNLSWHSNPVWHVWNATNGVIGDFNIALPGQLLMLGFYSMYVGVRAALMNHATLLNSDMVTWTLVPDNTSSVTNCTV